MAWFRPELERDWITARGRDRATFLQGMFTNDLASLVDGQGCYAFQLDATGHVLSDAHILVLDDRILIGVEPGCGLGVIERLEAYCVMERCGFTLDSAETGTISLFGSGTAVEAALGALLETPPNVEGHHAMLVQPAPGRIFKCGPIENAWYRLLVRRHEVEIWSAALRSLGFTAGDAGDWCRWRIRNAIPVFGVDIDSRMLAMESEQIQRAIHFRKGCYIGQEVVARVDARGKVNRKLVRLRTFGFNDPREPLISNGKVVGTITSHTVSESDGEGLAFGVVRAEFVDGAAELGWGTGSARVLKDAAR